MINNYLYKQIKDYIFSIKEQYNISSRNVITFKASKILLKYINNNLND